MIDFSDIDIEEIKYRPISINDNTHIPDYIGLDVIIKGKNIEGKIKHITKWRGNYFVMVEHKKDGKVIFYYQKRIQLKS